MAQLVKHLKQSTIADGPDPNQVNPSDWNASHVFSGGALGGLLMRDTSDATYGASWLASVAAGSVLISNGVGAVPTWAASLALSGNLSAAGTLTAGGLVTCPSLTVNGSATITGNVTMAGTVGTGNLVMSGTSAQFTCSSGTAITLNVRNPFAGTGNNAEISIGNDAQTRAFIAQVFASNFASSGIFNANGTTMITQGAGGLSVGPLDAAPLRFATNGLERCRLAATGELLIGTAVMAPAPGCGLGIAVDATQRLPVAVQNMSTGATGNLLTFFNYGNGVAGAIAMVNTSTVAYNTTSDARLKDDGGPASDVSALRALIVHDFTWKANGARARGVFAQEAHDLFPSAVSAGTDDRTERGDLAQPWMTDYSKFVPDLIVGWQQHDAALAEVRAALALKG